MLLRALTLVLPALLAAGGDEVPDLRLTLEFAKPAYELGEPIEVVMRTTYTGREKLAVWHIGYDRCGRIPEIDFFATDAEGKPVADPVGDYLGGYGGGMRTSSPLRPGGPYEQTVTLSEWVRFDAPGRYRVVGRSSIVARDTAETGEPGGAAITTTSEPVTIEILPPNEDRRRARLDRAKTDLESDDEDVREAAARDLRFMVDPRTIPLLLAHLDDPFGNVVVEARFGLLSFPDLSPVAAAVQAMLDDDGTWIAAEDVGMYAEILALDEMRKKGLAGGWGDQAWADAYFEATGRWEKAFVAKLSRGLSSRPPGEAVKAYVDGMAIGSLYPRDDEKIWHFVLANLGQAQAMMEARATFLISELRLESLVPDLKAVAQDETLSGGLRSAAMVALHSMAEDPYRDLLFADLVSPEPVFTDDAHATLGDYRAEEVGEQLLALLLSKEGEPRDVAGRIRDFGGSLSAEQLLDAIAKTGGDRGPLLTPLALASPESAVPFLRRALEVEGRRARYEGVEHFNLLVRLDCPAAQALLREFLLSPDPIDRVEALRALQQACGPGPDAMRPRRPDARLAPSFVPEALLLFRGDPVAEVRVEAMRLLAAVTGVPKNGAWSATLKKARAWRPRWEAWWSENGPRHGRWGRVRHGLSMRCVVDGGAFRAGEPIPATVTFRRIEGARTLRGTIRVQAEYRPVGAAGEPDVLDGEAVALPGKATLGASLGSEVSFRVDLGAAGSFGKPGTYLVTVRQALSGPDQATNWSERDLVVAPPLTIRVEPVE